MKNPQAIVHVRGSAIEVVLGVILGAALTFGSQYYLNRAERHREAIRARAGHIERMMTASGTLRVAAMTYPMKLADAAMKWRAAGVVAINADNLLPDVTAANELWAISSLYLPETEDETVKLCDAFRDFATEVLKTLPLKVQQYKSGDPPVLLDQKLIDDVTGAAKALEIKLSDLAKKDRTVE